MHSAKEDKANGDSYHFLELQRDEAEECLLV